MANLIDGTESSDILFGTLGDDQINGLGGDDTIIGTTGTDIIDGGDGIDTLDYSSSSNKITLLNQGFFNNGTSSNSQIVGIEEIIGAAGQANEINAANGIGGVSLNVNLGAKSLVIENIPGLGSQTFTVENFVNVKGSIESDVIIGDDARNNLRGLKGDDVITGSGGNDVINGNNGNDTLTGSDSAARGARERDVLRGAGGTDFFILGDEVGSFYQSNGNGDLAQIRDFSFGEQIQLGSDETYDLQTNNSGFKLFLTTDSQNDLIANVKIIASSIPSSSLQTRSAAPLNPIDVFVGDVPEGEFSISSGQTIGDIFVGA